MDAPLAGRTFCGRKSETQAILSMRPLRSITAMLALLSLTVSVVEQGWAASCVEMGDGSPVAAHAPESGHGHDGHGPSDAPERTGSEPAPCPMVAPAGATCGLAALPAIGEGSPVVPDPGTLVPPAIDRVPGFLAFAALFRPPRQ